ncbi:MAG: glycosyl hydrolase [Syntrophomonas sp.]|uniref:glycoside hydrolase family 26 protein n=1 Tax=Syntrophomonas sp. TaxID=2053627 RepID=UPI002625DF8F|nr:glycosyl hydrolase [Syntrophomonas sp.]MDD4627345.1 glycosyl hydrolase [Syntrophomonas sp.]
MKTLTTSKLFKCIMIIISITLFWLVLSGTNLQTSGFLKIEQRAGSAELPPAAQESAYLIVCMPEDRVIFVNQVDGYGITIPAAMKVTENESSYIRMVLEDEHRRMEIYKQPLTANNISANAYISYSNYFLKNTADHKAELQKKTDINGFPTVINQWSRNKLLNVADDKNYYACIDIMDKGFVYTFLVKADIPFDQCGGYEELFAGFYTFPATVKPSTVKMSKTENEFWNTETRDFYNQYFSPESDLTWGIFKYSAPQDMWELNHLEKQLEHDFKFLLVYKHVQKTFTPGYVKSDLDKAYAKGKTLELTLQTTSQEAGEGNMVYDILNGQYDPFLQAFAAETAAFGHPVLFRFGNEMNGDWCEYSSFHTARDPEIYKALYKYIYEIFTATGAENVIWVWNPNEKSFPNFKWNHEIMYYPGDEYVDVVGLTGYNTGNYYNGEKWRSFTEIYDELYLKAVRVSDKPLMITEFSSSNAGGSKEAWVEDMFDNLSKYPRIKVAIWWNGCDLDANGQVARSYFIDEPQELLKIFRDHLKDCK